MTKGIVALLAAFAGIALAQMRPPVVGVVRTDGGDVRPVQGLHANLIYQSPIATQATAVSFSDTYGLIATRSQIALVTIEGTPVAQWPTDETNLIVDIAAGPDTAIAWLTGSQTLLHWHDGQFRVTPPVPLDPGLQVTSVRAVAGMAELQTISPGGSASKVVVDLTDGAIRSVAAYPGLRGPVLSFGTLLIFFEEHRWVAEGPDGSRRFIAIVQDGITFTRMADDWLHIASAVNHREWALHVTEAQLELSELPVSRTKPIGTRSWVASEIRP